jgi:hypothetical protein
LAKEQEVLKGGLRPPTTPEQEENSITNEVIEGVKGDSPLLVDEEKIFDEPPKLIRQKGRKVKEGTPAQLEREERKRIREAEAKAKALAKEEKRKEGVERNRLKARERYRRIAEEKKQKKVEEDKTIRKEIVKDNTKPSRMPQKEPNMDFGTFASYMMKYEDLKLQYAKQQDEKKRLEEAAKPKPVEKSYHPDKYPLQNLYDPRKRYNNAFPHDNFF